MSGDQEMIDSHQNSESLPESEPASADDSSPITSTPDERGSTDNPSAIDSDDTENPPLEDVTEALLDDLTDEATGVDTLTKALEKASAATRDNWDRVLRVRAEMENLRRRTEKDLHNAHKFALEKFTKELLPVIDSLELGSAAASGDVAEVVTLREGVELTLKQFRAVLEKFDVVALDPIGEPFNPDQHQAMAMQPTDKVAPNCVLQVFQKGYLLNGRLIRPAMVVVAQAPIDHA